MPDTMFFSLLLNIGLLVLIATMLTKIPIVRSMLLYDKNSAGCTVSLAVIFGLVSIISTYTGVHEQGAIVNTRVIGVLAAGLLGGPWVGMGAALIGGLHRYFFDIGGFTAVSCAVSTFMEGLAGCIFSRRFKMGKNRQLRNLSAYRDCRNGTNGNYSPDLKAFSGGHTAGEGDRISNDHHECTGHDHLFRNL